MRRETRIREHGNLSRHAKDEPDDRGQWQPLEDNGDLRKQEAPHPCHHHVKLIDPPPGNPPGDRQPIFFPRRVSDQFGQVILIGNRAENFAYALSARLRKRFGDRLALDLGYAFNRSADMGPDSARICRANSSRVHCSIAILRSTRC